MAGWSDLTHSSAGIYAMISQALRGQRGAEKYGKTNDRSMANYKNLLTELK